LHAVERARAGREADNASAANTADGETVYGKVIGRGIPKRWGATGMMLGVVMPTEFMFGRPLSSEELELIRLQIDSDDKIDAVSDEVGGGIVERNWPHLLSKLPPAQEPKASGTVEAYEIPEPDSLGG
jgi:hypothetical protein